MGDLIGIDEAGVGPVLGPLVVGGVRVEEKSLKLFREIRVKDSKLFGGGERAFKRRENLWQTISGSANVWVEKITATELDGQNWVLLEIERIAKILRRLWWWEAEKIFVGWLGKLGEERFLRFLGKSLASREKVSFRELRKKIVYQRNAEEETVVAAASILAKVERDKEVKRLCESLGFSYVSGYANSNTAGFLRKCKERYGSLPSFVRKSWRWEPLQELLL